MEFALYYPSTEELETVISNLATRDELRRQQLCSVPKKYEFLGLRSESRPFFWQKCAKMVWFWPKWDILLLKIFRPFCQKITLLDESPRNQTIWEHCITGFFKMHLKSESKNPVKSKLSKKAHFWSNFNKSVDFTHYFGHSKVKIVLKN